MILASLLMMDLGLGARVSRLVSMELGTKVLGLVSMELGAGVEDSSTSTRFLAKP